jgi:hypothetical protein
MKKYIFGLAVLAGWLFTSCNTDNIGAVYNSTAQNISFENDEPATIVVKGSQISVPVTLVRSNRVGSYTAHYTLEADEEGIFTDKNEGKAVFADGEWKTTITVDAANMKGGNMYTFTLTLSDEDILTTDTVIGKDNNIMTTVSVMCDYNWIEAGKCLFADYTFSDGTMAENVTILNAEGTNLYRIEKPFMAVYGEGSDGFTTDTGITFEFNDDESITFVTDNKGIVVTADQYDFVWVDQYVPDYCNIVQNDDIYECTMLGLVSGAGYYTGFAFSFQWTEGWPGN